LTVVVVPLIADELRAGLLFQVMPLSVQLALN
jgi:hypothetical protein